MENPFAGKETETITKDDVAEVKAEDLLKEAEVKSEYLKSESEESKPLTKMDILKKHGGLESNVPINSPYWRMK
jgi:hypothetical protein